MPLECVSAFNFYYSSSRRETERASVLDLVSGATIPTGNTRKPSARSTRATHAVLLAHCVRCGACGVGLRRPRLALSSTERLASLVFRALCSKIEDFRHDERASLSRTTSLRSAGRQLQPQTCPSPGSRGCTARSEGSSVPRYAARRPLSAAVRSGRVSRRPGGAPRHRCANGEAVSAARPGRSGGLTHSRPRGASNSCLLVDERARAARADGESLGDHYSSAARICRPATASREAER